MKWISRELMLPILLSISITSFGATLLYLLYKKDDDYNNSKESHITARHTSIRCTFPKMYISAIIGRNGSVIKDIQDKSGTHITLEDNNMESDFCSYVIWGNAESVALAQALITNIINKQPVIETKQLLVPQKVCGRIIGKRRETLQQIQISSGAKIFIGNDYNDIDPNATRQITIKGTAKQISTAVSQIEDKVQEENEAQSRIETSYASRVPRSISPHSRGFNTSNTSKFIEPLLPQDGLMEVYVSAMETPNQFWVQVIGPGSIALDDLVSQMTSYYNEPENQELHGLKNVTTGQMVAAKFSFDNQWYRAEVISILPDSQYKVYYVDYGDYEVVSIDNLLDLGTDMLTLRLQAVECSLANLKPQESEWSTEAYDKFADLTSLAQWKVLVAKVRGYKERSIGCGRSRREGSPIPCIDLYDKNDEKNINIGQTLIHLGYAQFEEDVWTIEDSTLSVSDKRDFPSSSSPILSPSLAKRALICESATIKTASSIQTHTEEVGLTSSQKEQHETIEKINTAMPVRNQTEFALNKQETSIPDGNINYKSNGNTSPYAASHNNVAMNNIRPTGRYAPAGYESESDDSDKFEMG